MNEYNAPVVCIGGGFTGLSAAYDLARAGRKVHVLEKEEQPGGLASSFQLNGVSLERFYHHWFNNDRDVLQLIDDLGCSDDVLPRPTKTGIYVDGKIFRLSKPVDILRFTPLSLMDRIRMGLLVLKARKVKNWRELESITAEEWLIDLCGRNVYETVWRPLLQGKFGSYANRISAVWMWNKLALRGGSRGKSGEEILLYYKGGFAALIEKLAREIENMGGKVSLGAEACDLDVENGEVKGVKLKDGNVLAANSVLLSLPLPAAADVLKKHVSEGYFNRLNRIEYLANICLVITLNEKLSDIYWLNVADGNFPYVGIIEHTNMEPPSTYGGEHVVYLSKYLTEDSDLFNMPDQEVYEFSLSHLKKLFPDFSEDKVTGYRVFRAGYSQPLVERYYSRLIPDTETPIKGVHLRTMAQIYPEDRGSNYAVREGRDAAKIILETA